MIETKDRSLKFQQRLLRFLPGISLFFVILTDEFLFANISFSLKYSVIFFWAIYRPDLMPAFLLLLAGIVADGLAGENLAKTSLLFLMAFLMAFSLRRSLAQASFSVIWVAFCFYNLCLVLVFYLLEAFAAGELLPQTYFFYFYITAIASYPFISYVLEKLRVLLD